MKKSLSKTIALILLVVLCIDATESQVIYTPAGNGVNGFGGDNGPAVSAALSNPCGVALDAVGNMYIADANNNRIRKVDQSGTILTYAGTGLSGYSGDGGAANLAKLNQPIGLAFDASGNLYIADALNHCIRKVNPAGIISTYAGTGSLGFSGDGGTANLAQLSYPVSITFDASGNLYIGDCNNGRVRKVNSSGIISTFAGGGPNGDGGPAISAQIQTPYGLITDAAGNVFIAEWANHRVRKVNTSGIISTFAGTGAFGYGGDGGPATAAGLYGPFGLAMDITGNLYIADKNNDRVRKVDPSGSISTYAGTGSGSFSGDGGPPYLAQLFGPAGLAFDSSGNIYIADAFNNRIRKVCDGPACITGLISPEEYINKIGVFPNPGNGYFIVQIEREIKNGEIVLFNSIGQKVLEKKITQGRNSFNETKLASGLYSFILFSDKQKISDGKLLVD